MFVDEPPGRSARANELFGRDGELRELGQAFSDGGRPVVVVGLPGIGKTALARAFCASVGAPVVDCDVHGLSARAELVDAIAGVLGARSSSPDLVLRELAARENAILLLDGVGQLDADASHWVASASARVSMLLTARTRPAFLQLRLLRLGPLAYPRRGTRDDLSPAVSMVVARLRDHGMAEVDEALRVDATAIACRLEGHPGAIELAVARAATLGSARVCRELEEQVVPRGSSLELSIRQSLNGLDEAQRELLGTLARLPGHLELDDLSMLADAGAAVPDSLPVLVDRSLVQVHQIPHSPSTLRYSVHALVREIGEEVLAPASGTAFEERLWRWAVRVAAEYLDTRSTHCLARVARSAGMLERAWRTLSATGDHTHEAACVAAALAALMSIHGPTPELVELVSASAESDAPADLRSELVRQLALRDLERSDTSGAIERLQRAASLAREGESPAQAARALAQLAGLVARTGDFEAAGQYVDQAEDAAGEEPHPRMLVGAVRTFVALLAGDLGEARKQVERYRALAIRIGDLAFEASAASHLGNLAHDAGHRAEAAEHYARGLELVVDPRYEAVFSTPLVAHFVGYRAIVLHELEDPEALTLCQDAVRRSRAARSARFEALFEAWRGVMLAAAGDPDSAERAMDVADGVGTSIQSVTRVLRAHVDLARSRSLEGEARWCVWARAARRWSASSTAEAALSRALRVARRNVEAALIAAMPTVEGESGLWVSWDGVGRRGSKEFDSSHRPTLRAILLELVLTRLAEPGATLSVEHLVRVGWPEENPVGSSGTRRVQVAISTLRKQLLGDDLETIDGEYRLAPSATVAMSRCMD